MKILVPDSIPLDLGALDERDVEAVVYETGSPVPEEHVDAEVLIVWETPLDVLRDAAGRLTSLRLVQGLAAGPDAIVAAGFPDSVLIASGRTLHDGPVAEHALALVLSVTRRLDLLRDAQGRHEWTGREVTRAQSSEETRGLWTLDGARVTVWGFGSIAGRLAPLLTSLGAEVTGVASTAGERHGYPVRATSDIADVLRDTDVLVSILPATPETDGVFGADLIDALPDTAAFVNVGRGSVVDEDALVAALRDGRLRAAAIDVTREEPLPSDSPLWEAPNLLITPHVAGGRPIGASPHVVRAIEAVLDGREPENVVSR